MKQNKYYDMDKVIEEALERVREKNMLVEKCLKLSSDFYIFFARIKAVDRKSRTEFEKYVSSLEFNGCFHSNCIEEYKFTNFLDITLLPLHLKTFH